MINVSNLNIWEKILSCSKYFNAKWFCLQYRCDSIKILIVDDADIAGPCNMDTLKMFSTQSNLHTDPVLWHLMDRAYKWVTNSNRMIALFRGAESSKKIEHFSTRENFCRKLPPRGFFTDHRHTLFQTKTQVKTCNSFLAFVTVRTTSEFFPLVLFSSCSKQPNPLKLIRMHHNVLFF